LVLQLVDVRHEPQPVDEVVRLALQQRGLPSAVVLTKGDKLSRGAAQSQIDALRRGWQLDDETPVVLTSSQTGAGIAALQRLITIRIAAHAAPGTPT
jgi:GTP-binding protein